MVKVDQVTLDKERLSYARIMVEMNIEKDLPDKICFRNEKGVMVEQQIQYEWRPTFCNKYRKFGHDTAIV